MQESGLPGETAARRRRLGAQFNHRPRSDASKRKRCIASADPELRFEGRQDGKRKEKKEGGGFSSGGFQSREEGRGATLQE